MLTNGFLFSRFTFLFFLFSAPLTLPLAIETTITSVQTDIVEVNLTQLLYTRPVPFTAARCVNQYLIESFVWKNDLTTLSMRGAVMCRYEENTIIKFNFQEVLKSFREHYFRKYKLSSKMLQFWDGKNFRAIKFAIDDKDFRSDTEGGQRRSGSELDCM